MKRNTFSRTAIIGSLGMALMLAACGGQDDTRSPEEIQGMEGMPGMGGTEAAPGMGGMGGTPGMTGMGDVDDMQRHAQELDEMTPRVHDHIQVMRQLPPEQQHERMGEHVAQMSQMLTLVNRQLREMDGGMGMSDEQMGEMMGMSGQEHRRMMESMQSIRTDLERLQTAPVDEIREQMPAHLERVDSMIQMMERNAEYMRGM